MERGFNGKNDKSAHLYISHTHWDHIQGIPFFVPAYIPGNRIQVYGEAKVEDKNFRDSLVAAVTQHSDQRVQLPAGLLQVMDYGVRHVLEEQQKARNFPAPLTIMKGIDRFWDVRMGHVIFANPQFVVDTSALNHPNNSVSYRMVETKDDGSRRRFVYSTDWEPFQPSLLENKSQLSPDNIRNLEQKITQQERDMIAFWEGADLVITDSQYEPYGLDEFPGNKFMVTCGHSDFHTNIKLATKASVKKLKLFHLEPKMNDEYYDLLQGRAQKYAEAVAKELGKSTVEVSISQEGEWIQL